MTHTILVTLEAKPGKEQELKQTLSNLVAPTLQEQGCINYQLHQSKDNPAKFMFYESWRDKAAHAQHRETPHMAIWREKKDDLLLNPTAVTEWVIL